MIRKERKYSLIWPFWAEIVVEVFIWKRARDFGRVFSSHVRSSNREAVFWPAVRLVWGIRRCMMVGKYPREFEKLKGVDAGLRVRFRVRALSSSASIKPNRVTARAVSLI